jgi:hypothetical protein
VRLENKHEKLQEVILNIPSFLSELSPKGRRKLGYPSKSLKSNVKLPLIGKTIYLDVKESKHLKQLREDLKKLGAVSNIKKSLADFPKYVGPTDMSDKF